MTDFPVYRCSSAFVYHCEYKRKSKKEGRSGSEAIFILCFDISIMYNVLRYISRWKGTCTLIVVAVRNTLQYHCNDMCVH